MASSRTGENDETQSNIDVDPEFKRWMDSAATMLGCIGDKEIEACSISIVPEHLRESNKEAYMPKVVSIGPLHRGIKRELYMKEIKWHYMLSFLRRAKEPKKCLKQCSKAMYNLDALFRASYVDDLKSIDSYGLAKIMLLDGCFLVELLIRNNKDIFGNKPVAKKEEILTDLILLENQIPFYVLRKLYTTLSPPDIKGKLVSDALSLFGYKINEGTNANATHLLELLHSCVTGNLDEQGAETENKPSSDARSVTIDEGSKQMEQSTEVNESHGKLELKRCATKLQAAGVTIKHRKSQKNEVGFDFDIECGEGKLEIPELRITGTTEAKWRNFIAWEHNKSRSGISSKFSWYALFIQGLICCEHDIQLLRDKKVITVVSDDAYSSINRGSKKKKKLTNKDLVILFKKIADGVDGDKVNMDLRFKQLFQKLNKHPSTGNIFKEKFIVFSHYFKCFLTNLRYKWEKSYAIFRLEYTPTVWKKIGIVYAAFLLGLTIAQFVLQANGK